MTTPDAGSRDTGDWVRVCLADEVPQRYPLGVLLPDEDSESDRSRVCIARDGERIQGMLDRCPHRDISLSGGVIKDGLLTCPGHFWNFALSDGHRTDLPEQKLTLYPTKVENGSVWVKLPDEVPPMSMREWLLSQANKQVE